MPRKSFDTIAKRDIARLVDYAQKRLDLNEVDALYLHNELLGFFKLTEPYNEEIGEYELYSTLDSLFSFALRRDMYEEHERLFFEGRIMGLLMPRPNEVIEKFDAIAAADGSMKAAEWLRDLETSATYLRRPDLDKNIKWTSDNSRGNIVVTINLAKPEKTAEEVERAKNAQTGYPKCVLCRENLGFVGNAAIPARQHIRVIPFELDGEDWFMQFSPYEYFDEHVIAISDKHRPMHIDEGTFRRMLDFVELFPKYFIGSNAALPIVGGSVLAHDHYQGGKKVLPIFVRPSRKTCFFRDFPDIDVTIVDWYNSVVKIEGDSRSGVVALASRILHVWENYTDESVNIVAHTDAQHNAVTPIAYLNDTGMYTVMLILRNNRTDDSHPFGIFHPTADMHNIKQESIGLIEAQGLFILPGRLAAECAEIRNILTGKIRLDFAALAKENNPLHKHFDMIAQLAAEYGTELTEGKAANAVINYINKTCEKILDCTAVFKNDEQGQAAFERFLDECQSK